MTSPTPPGPGTPPEDADALRARVARLELRVERERAARAEAERLLETKASELYQANQQLQAMASDLEAQVEARTAEVRAIEGELRQSQKMQAVGQLAGGIAHDFNNLLTVITGVAQLLRGELPAAHEARDLLDELDEAARRGAELTAQLLAFSRPAPADPQRFALDEAVDAMGHLLRRLLTERVALRLDLSSGAWVRLHRSGLDQMLLNLAANARDAMPAGGTFTLRSRRVELDEAAARRWQLAPGPYACLEAQDTGLGMPADVAARAFEPFFTTKPLGKGTGLGLANAYALVRHARGHIEVRSREGEGTRIVVHLPEAEGGVTRPSEATAGAGATHHGERVLVVDDEPGVRRVTSTLLRRQGFTVVEAEDGAAALRAARTAGAGLDAVVSDVRMPGMNGYDLACALRAERPTLPVLLMSGFLDDEGLQGRIDAAGFPFLAKPFRNDELLERVRRMLTPA